MTDKRKTTTSREVIHASAILEVSPSAAFSKFTNPDEIRVWLIDPYGGGSVDIEARAGGKFELFWNAPGGKQEGTPGCTITVFDPPRLLGFNWKGPTEVADPMNRADPLTHVTVTFITLREGARARTAVELVHSGWGSSVAFQAGRAYFESAWTSAFKNLESICRRSGRSYERAKRGEARPRVVARARSA
jgi:uncharacterized protein YndB with AHSA1/START domain